jgi:hypothetical protein
MKNKVIILVAMCLALLALVGTIIMLLGLKKSPSIEEFDLVGEFDLKNYQKFLDESESNSNVGEINDARTAIEIAKEIFEKFGVTNELPIKAYYDLNSDCWLLHGTLPKKTYGGVTHIIIKSNGDILAIWSTQ